MGILPLSSFLQVTSAVSEQSSATLCLGGVAGLFFCRKIFTELPNTRTFTLSLHCKGRVLNMKLALRSSLSLHMAAGVRQTIFYPTAEEQTILCQ